MAAKPDAAAIAAGNQRGSRLGESTRGATM